MRHDLGRWAATFAAVLAALTAACGPSVSPTKTQPGSGQVGQRYDVTVSRQPGGNVSTADGRIFCGSDPTATRCGPVSFGWTEVARLVATPDAGNMFSTWVGSCYGRTQINGEYVCLIDTTRNGADKFVGAVFGPAGRTLHQNFTDPALHGASFLDFVAKKADAYECTYCHGADYAGRGTALSCTECHERSGFPSWLTNCNFCHSAPPPPPPLGHHPRVSSDTLYCWGCHQGTVDANGVIIPGGNHMNGQIDATGGHADGFGNPAVHGREFFQFASGGEATVCTDCHGEAYDIRIAAGKSCNTCHEAAGWTAWRTNCSFCHGVRDDATKAAAYDVTAHPTWAAPPDAISQRLGGGPAPDRTGAHTIHLTQGPYAAAFRCDVCHAVPSTVSHIGGREARASVVLMAPGQAAPDPTGYDPSAGTCATRCHGAAGSPPWSSTGIACDACHAVPPATNAHAGLSGADLTVCAGCHPDTIATDGTLKASGGKHVNGTVDRIGGHAAGFALPTAHGPQFLDATAGVAGTQSCQTCHGTNLGLCTNCHALPANGGWVSWQTNCTFCHGQRTASFTAANLVLASPPQAVSQRLTGVAAPTRTGKHNTHLNGKPARFSGYACGACHAVPTDLGHISQSRRATVTFSAANAFPGLTAAERAAPALNPVAVYDPATNRCSSNYCHGATLTGAAQQTWSSAAPAINSCTACHGDPPATGRIVPADQVYCAEDCSLHVWHIQAMPDFGFDSCSECHNGSAPGNTAGRHVNGKFDVVFGPLVTEGTWDATAGTCAVSCHTDRSPIPWR